MVQDRYRTPVVVVGCGAGGAPLGVRDSGEIRHVPALAPRGVTSTAGAGDAVAAAAFMHVYAATGNPDAAIEQAVMFAGYAVGAEHGGSAFLTGPQARRDGSGGARRQLIAGRGAAQQLIQYRPRAGGGLPAVGGQTAAAGDERTGPAQPSGHPRTARHFAETP